MAKPLLDDDLWTLIAPLLPQRPPRRLKHSGRKPVDDWVALTGILLVLKSGIPWEMLPVELGCCGMTNWRRFRDWRQAGVWEHLHTTVLAELRRRESLDLSRAIVDSSSVQAVLGGKKTGPNPTDRRKAGSKNQLITDAHGMPLAAIVTGANPQDVMQLLPLVDAIPPIAGKRCAHCYRPQRVLGDRAYGSQPHRRALAERGVKSGLAWRRLPHGTCLDTQRWVVERTIAWLHQFRRLRVRYEKRADIHEALLSMGCCLICFRTLRRSFC